MLVNLERVFFRFEFLKEEKELELRFGDESREYKQKTHFLITKIWK